MRPPRSRRHHHRGRRSRRSRPRQRLRPARSVRSRRGKRRIVRGAQPGGVRYPHRSGAAVRVVVADDSVLLHEGLARVLGGQGFDVVALVGTPRELLDVVASTEVDVAVVDIRMPRTHTDEGLIAAEQLRASHPMLGVLVLSQYVEAEYALRLLARGEQGAGYLLK